MQRKVSPRLYSASTNGHHHYVPHFILLQITHCPALLSRHLFSAFYLLVVSTPVSHTSTLPLFTNTLPKTWQADGTDGAPNRHCTNDQSMTKAFGFWTFLQCQRHGISSYYKLGGGPVISPQCQLAQGPTNSFSMGMGKKQECRMLEC